MLCVMPTTVPVPSALNVRTAFTVPVSCETVACPAARLGLRLASKPVDDSVHVALPVMAQRPTMLGSATSGSATHLTLRPLGSEACMACPAGQPITGCASAAGAASITAAANEPPQIIFMSLSQLVGGHSVVASGARCKSHG